MAQPTFVKEIAPPKVVSVRHFIGVGDPNDDVTGILNDITQVPPYSTYLDTVAVPAEENPVLYMKVIASYTGTGTSVDPYVYTYGWGVCFTVADPA